MIMLNFQTLYPPFVQIGYNMEGIDKNTDKDSFWMTKAILDKSKTPFFRLSFSGQVEYVIGRYLNHIQLAN